MVIKEFFIKPVLAITNPVLPEAIEFNSTLSTIITLLLIGGVIVSFGAIILGAYRWITAGGDKGKLQEAQHWILNALIGLIILFCIFVVLNLMGSVFGINLMDLNLPRVNEEGGPRPTPVCHRTPPDPACECINGAWFCP